MLKLAHSWVWDSWFTFDGEKYHAFYLRASRALGDPERRHRYPFVGHAISTDLKNWTEVADALAVSESPAFDSWTTWTGSVVKDDDGLWWMFYTGSSHEDGGFIQAIGAATSTDLMTWTKLSSEALVRADERWYELLDFEKWHDQAWRDPWVFKADDGLWHMFITARSIEGEDRFSRGVVGHAVSSNLKDWEVLPPLTNTNSGFGHMEVFQVEEIDGVPTLLWCSGLVHMSESAQEKYGAGGMFSATGKSMLGPFDIENATLFPHDSIYAARVIQKDNEWFMIGFKYHEDGEFIGELTDPIPVTAKPGIGLIPKE